MAHGKFQEPYVIPLHIKNPVFFFGIGKGRGVNKDQIILTTGSFQPTEAVFLNRGVGRAAIAVQGQIHPRPTQIGG